MATINDEAENIWITRFGSNLWIGWRRGYQWSSGEVTSYENWHQGHPDERRLVDYARIGEGGRWFTASNDGNSGAGGYKRGIAEIPLTLAITRQGEVKEGAGSFTTSINLNAGNQTSGNLAKGAQVWWQISGITGDDLLSGTLSGSGTIQQGKLDIQHSLKVDTDSGEIFEVSVYSDAGLTQQIGTTNSVVIDEGVDNGNTGDLPGGQYAGSAPLIRANSLYTLTTTERDWRSAENNAISLGGHLVNIDSIGENDFIVDFFRESLDKRVLIRSRDAATLLSP
ncbi:C-type lectin domain-containing protein [Synechococcus sp. HJ21-Hayes]|uniref:C-type lectin domain-containing protein n=1 Tax=unclassified Synechococcus TaxID=2626047 RepID=UPI0020CD230D|nr:MULTISPECIES: C-type lectin domain-containing protein [unclassified Synechococcus]MCP9829955.1 C-type lectin domain-containing protein [Synechococcus sp. JJ3a-Johnson]MCP9852236.1 C-type lectin domain-containing protein [Synechococcus sp. HJ21-Hayes]